MAVLATIPDPEMPISIVDLGLVEDVRLETPTDRSESQVATISLLPTFVGCPALDMIREEVRRAVGRLPNIAEVEVRFVHDPRWTVDRISDAGRTSLRAHGVVVPDRGAAADVPHAPANEAAEAARLTRIVPLSITAGPGRGAPAPASTPVPCPFCGSKATHLDSPFGPTRCRMIYYCDACRNSFEHLKRVG